MGEDKKFINADFVGNYIEVDGIRTHYMEKGEGECLLLIHGLGQSMYTWRMNFDALSQYYRVIMLDLPGFGYSDKVLDFPYTIGEYAEFLISFMDALDVETFHVGAFSSGALYALSLAQRYKTRIRRLVLVTPGGVTQDYPFVIRTLYGTLFSRIALRMITPSTISYMLTECYFDQTLITDELIQSYWDPLSLPDARKCLYYAVNYFDETDVIDSLRDMQQQVLIIWGADDKWHSPEIAPVFHNPLTNSHLVNIRNCGHMAHEEKFERVNALVVEFLEWDGEIPQSDL